MSEQGKGKNKLISSSREGGKTQINMVSPNKLMAAVASRLYFFVCVVREWGMAIRPDKDKETCQNIQE